MTNRISVDVHQLGEYIGHKGSIYALAVDEEGGHLFSAGDDGIVAKWDLNGKWDEGEALLSSSRAIYTLLHLPKHDFLVAGASNGILYIYDLTKKALVNNIQLGAGAIFDLKTDPPNQMLWVFQGNGLLSGIQLANGKLDKQIQLSQAHLRSIETTEDGSCWYVGSSDHHIHCWNPQTYEKLYQWKAHENSVFVVKRHPNGTHLLSGGRDAHLNVWLLGDKPTLEQSIPAHLFTINDLCFSPDSKYFLSAARDKTIKLWDASSYQLLKVIDAPRNNAHKHSVNKLLWLTSDNSVISCSDDRRLIRWRLTMDES